LSVASIDQRQLVDWPTTTVDSPVRASAAAFDRAEAGWLVVLDGGQPVGWLARDAAADGVARDGMTAMAALPVDTKLDTVMAALLSTPAPGVAVTDAGRYVGVVTATSIVPMARGVDR
jgi:CBS domain-containing protein